MKYQIVCDLHVANLPKVKQIIFLKHISCYEQIMYFTTRSIIKITLIIF